MKSEFITTVGHRARECHTVGTALTFIRTYVYTKMSADEVERVLRDSNQCTFGSGNEQGVIQRRLLG